MLGYLWEAWRESWWWNGGVGGEGDFSPLNVEARLLVAMEFVHECKGQAVIVLWFGLCSLALLFPW